MEKKYFFLRRIDQSEPKMLTVVIISLQLQNEKTLSADMETADLQPA